ncbi:MAG: phosphopyruvate hydratase [Lachnospiraceae bacterium]|jgi:enolase|nr:phosphopyruvate hydratase [Lachnospiraceae bacterium]MCI9134493.1 phosphopyruvate hydratase [Lachnospiraceae bacterium]
MHLFLPITSVYAREILDSRGNPTVEVEVTVDMEHTARASVPSGASTGTYEAVELRDGQFRYLGLGVEKAVHNVNVKLADILMGENALEQSHIDHLLVDTDGTDNKSNLGANATLGVSMAVAKAAAKAVQMPLFQYLGGVHAKRLPVPMMNILNGGKHADNTVDLQEFMIMPVGACCFKEGLRMCAEVYYKLKLLLKKRNLSTGVGDEGGFAPDLRDTREALDCILEAISMAGFDTEHQMKIAIDAAASEFYEKKSGRYFFEGESRMAGEKVYRTTEELIDYYEELIRDYPIISIEDGLMEEDWDGWKELTRRLGDRVQLVGDDLFVTNVKRLGAGIQLHAGNAILIKPNQIGTVSETMDAIELAQRAGYGTVISHRSGETEEDFIADLAVAVNAGQIKTGAPCRMERIAKYNQLLRIEEELAPVDTYYNPFYRIMD